MVQDHNPAAFKHLFGQDLLKRMAKAIKKVHPEFRSKALTELAPLLEALEMKARVRLIREALFQNLPQDFSLASEILWHSVDRGQALKNFDLWPYSDYLQHHGLDQPELALKQLKRFTPFFTSEFAVRPYLRSYPDLTLSFLQNCAQDEDVHVRRWASEGSRPRLPWGERLNILIADPYLTQNILNQLKFDPELYVRKSVANHLNDIAKDHPLLVIETLQRWQIEAGLEHRDKVTWILQRALRTLIKMGHADALSLIGVDKAVKIDLAKFKVKQKVLRLGEALSFSFELQSKARRSQKLVVDYVMHFLRANGKTSPKVFKLKNLQIEAGEKLIISKSHVIKKVTTRSYYPGRQYLEIQINGQVLHRVAWKLEAN